MFWKYFLFETKLLLYNRKNWFLGVALLLFFPIFILYTNQIPSESLRESKKAEADAVQYFFDFYADEYQDGTPEQQEILENLLQQSSLINYQVFYIRTGEVTEDYIENGLQLAELRLKAHELGNKGIPKHLIVSKEDIEKEDALLRFVQEEQIMLDSNLFLTKNQLVAALSLLSGLPFVFFILLSGSEIIVYERRHETVMSGFPISFMKKINTKVFLYFVHTMVFLVIGLFLGNYVLSKELGTSTLTDPVIIYNNASFEAITMFHYLLYCLLAMAVITVFTLYLSILLNILFKSAYANVLVGLGLFLLPFLFLGWGLNFSFFQPLKYIDYSNVLSGNIANQLGNSQIDYWYALLWLVVPCIMLVILLFAKNKLTYRRIK